MAATLGVKAQSCDELMKYVKVNGYGTTYNSLTSDAISKVTFYEMAIDYNYYYFAIVCFERKHTYSCDEYLYVVNSNTKFNYATNYQSSAGQAFWDYIQPHNANLGCAPDF
jgi:hypothetical protein